ncbi:hypothetical protein GMRT_15282 [Giardia muris]|uniref:Uncharacterized protein n=1 Tax=Giardia muris TaxID=5742 RepID=A0A4Z1T600_GIAMU|nr:hypothetical protein GMRT_15282 [Giardia muris]|eukprot:TNJ27891.1 hypothetical protein GMRT_15282 [Giardia muris]
MSNDFIQLQASLKTLTESSPPHVRQDAEHYLLHVRPELLCNVALSDAFPLNQRLLACSALTAGEPPTREQIDRLIGALPGEACPPTVQAKLAQYIATGLQAHGQLRDITLSTFQSRALGVSVLREVFAAASFCTSKDQIKQLALLSTHTYSHIEGIPFTLLTEDDAEAILILLRAAADFLPAEPELFLFLSTTHRGFLELMCNEKYTSKVCDLYQTLLCNSVPKGHKRIPEVLYPVIGFFLEKAQALYELPYPQLRAVPACFSAIFSQFNILLRAQKEFILPAVYNFLCVFANHPSHLIFELIHPVLFNIFNDISLRGYEFDPRALCFLAERVCFYVNRYNLRTILTVVESDSLTDSEKYLTEDTLEFDTGFWLDWFGSFKGKCINLVSKLAVFYPRALLETITAGVSSFLIQLQQFEASLTEQQAYAFSMHTEQYYALDSLIAVVDACMSGCLKHVLYNHTFQDILQAETVTNLCDTLLSYIPRHPIVYYRIISALATFYKDALTVSSDKREEPKDNDSLKFIIARFFGPQIRKISRKYIECITFQSSILQEVGLTGEDLYTKMCQDTLALRRLVANRLNQMTEVSSIVRDYIVRTEEEFGELVSYIQSLSGKKAVTAYETVLLNQIISNILLAHGQSEGFKQQLASLLAQIRSVILSDQMRLYLQSDDAFIAGFHLTAVCTATDAAYVPCTQASLLARRWLMFALQEAKVLLVRIYEVFGMHESIVEFFPAIQAILLCLLRISSRGLLSTTPKYLTIQLSGQRLLANGTASGGMAKIDLENPQNPVPDIEHAYSWIERCLDACLSTLALEGGALLDLLFQANLAAVPPYLLRTVIQKLPRHQSLRELQLLQGLARIQCSDIVSVFTVLHPQELECIREYLVQPGQCALARTAAGVIWETLPERREVIAQNVLTLCNRALIDMCLALFTENGELRENIVRQLKDDPHFSLSLLSLFLALLMAFCRDVKCVAQLSIILDWVLVKLPMPDRHNANSDLEFTACQPGSPLAQVLTPMLILCYGLILQYVQYEYAQNALLLLAGRLLQITRSMAVTAFYAPDEHLVPPLISELLLITDAKKIRHLIRSSLVKAKRITVSVDKVAGITTAALLVARSDDNDSIEVHLGEYPVFDERDD